MLVKQSLSEQCIINCLHINYGIKVVTLTFLPLGADINASIYKAETQDKLSYFIKIKQGHHHNIGITLVELLHNAGIEQIIPPVKTMHGHLTLSVDDFSFVVYPFIDGQDGFSRTLTDEQWLILGKTLKRIHEIDLPSSIKQQIRREAYSAKWQMIVRSLYTHIEAKPIDDITAQKLLAFIKKNILIIQRLVNRAEQLAQIIQHESPPLVLCHSDIHAGNVLINNNTLYIVDWDDPIMAPKERDLMFIGGGVANVWNQSNEEVLFYKGYGKVEINRTILSYYRHERIVEDIAVYGQELLLTTDGNEDRLKMYQHFIAMFEQNDVIDIAFKTDIKCYEAP